MSALMSAPDIAKKSERRNQMILIFLYDTAARVSEMINIRVCDLHFDATIPYATLYGKGRKYRNIPLMEKTLEHLNRYLIEFHKDDNTDMPLFYAVSHGIKHKLSSDTPEKMVKRYAAKCTLTDITIPERVHCHMIRKTRAMDLYQKGIPLTHIQQLLEHENLSTTSGFYAFATLSTLAESLEKANPTNADKKWKDKKVMDKIYRL
jgi:integrase/recombinase XerD